MSDNLKHECGIAAVCKLNKPVSPAGPASLAAQDSDVVKLMPRMLLNLQNRGQLAAGLSSYDSKRPHLIKTYKNLGNVSEVFRMSHPAKHKSIIEKFAGQAAIGHTRYATCGKDDVSYAQPFERHHGRRWKWFSFAFNGNLANYAQLRDKLLSKRDYHFTLDADTEIIMHELSYRLRGDEKPDLVKVFELMSKHFDGAYNLAFMDANGRMVVARDPLGLRPLSYATQGDLFAAASESVALRNLGFTDIKCLEPGTMAIIEDGELRIERYAEPRRKAHCFFEWIYFSNVASIMDTVGVYNTRARSGEILAQKEDIPVDNDTIVVPVPDTAKAAADSFAYHLGVPCMEGLMRNRYVGRTFIQSGDTRIEAAKSKYIPLASVMEGKRVFLVEDSIVRSTTLRVLVDQIRTQGKAREVHVRVGCPPIVAPCFYGIDMSTLGELFAPNFMPKNYSGELTNESLDQMAKELGLDSLRYLSVPDLAKCIFKPLDDLCLGCVMGKYPTKCGNEMIAKAKQNLNATGRTYE